VERVLAITWLLGTPILRVSNVCRETTRNTREYSHLDEMQELEEAERYSIAALYTLALHTVAASAESYDHDDWGEEERDSSGAEARTKNKIDEHDSFWGRDLAAPGGFLDAVYWQLGLPTFKWSGLKALPSIAGQRSTPDVFRATVRSLISVLDAELASALPPATIQRNEPRPKPEDVWDSVISGSSDEEIFDVQTVNEIGGGVKLVHRNDSNNECEDGVEVPELPRQLSEEIKNLENIASLESHEDYRKLEYESLLHVVEEFEISPGGSPTTCDMESRVEAAQEHHWSGGEKSIPTSPIAIAGVWELLQCTIGASFAASEAALDIGRYEKDRFKASGDVASHGMKRQGPPPCVRWYDARARVALKMVCKWLYVDSKRLSTLEVLLGNDRAPATSRPGRSHTVSDRYRYWKVGAAAVGGGALFAVTGGLAAPAIAAGVGSLLGIVPGAAGAAAASAAGFLSTQAGVAALTTTMATAGAATTGSKMAYRTADVKHFGFYRLGVASMSTEKTHVDPRMSEQQVVCSTSQYKMNAGHLVLEKSNDNVDKKSAESTSNSSSWHSWLTPTKKNQDDTTTTEKKQEIALSPIPSLQTPKIEGINLSTIIGISGWITGEDDYIKPWASSIFAPESDRYALVWCKQELSALTSALAGLIAKGVTGQAARFGVQHLIAGGAGLVTALGPTVILGAAAGLLIDNAWTTAGERSDKAGKLLAHILLQGGTGGRPVTLIAHSMGARVVIACMEELVGQLSVAPAKFDLRKTKRINSIRGIIQDVLIMGTPVIPDPELFSAARSIVAGRFVNCYSTKDWLLSVLFWQGVSKPAAGLVPVDCPGIENINCSDIVSGHADYIEKLDEIFSLTGIHGQCH
jgi:hypothetical protein